MWVLPPYFNDTLAKALISRMCASDKYSHIAASVRNVGNQSLKLLQLYPGVVNYLLKKLATDQAITEFDVAIWRYMQLVNMTPRQCADELVAKSCKTADVYDKSTFNEAFIWKNRFVHLQ